LSSTFFPLIELFNRGVAEELEVAELTRYFNYGLDVPITVKRHFNYNVDVPVSVKRHFVDSLDVAINVKRHFAFSTDFEVDDTPAGVVYPFAGAIASIPLDTCYATVQACLEPSYPALFNAIGVIYGAADGTHFNLPDFRDRMLIGAYQDDSGVPKTNVTGVLTANGGSITLNTFGASVTRGTSGVSVGNHADHVHSGPASHTLVSNKQGSGSGSVVTTNTHGNTGNPTGALNHSVNEPNAGAGHDHGFTQPSNHTAIPPYFAVVYMIKT
jgi:microcystin-dependent protein